MFHVIDDDLNGTLNGSADFSIRDDQFFNQMGQQETHFLADHVVQRVICFGIRMNTLQKVK